MSNITYSNIELAKRIHKSACVVATQEELLDKKIDETKEEIIGVIKDIDGAVTNLSEKVLNLDVSIGEDFVTNIGVGGIPAGTSIENTDQLKRILKNMLLQLKYAEVVKQPSCTISPSSYVEEVGKTITPTFTLKFNDGTFKSYSNNGNTSTNISSGCKKVANSETYEIKDGTTWKSYTNGSEIKVKNSTINVRGKCSYSGSTAVPTNSDGSTTTQNGDNVLAFSGGSCTSGNCSITGKYQYYAGCSDVDPTADVIRAALNNTKNWIDTSKTVNVENTNTKMIFAIPASYSLVSAISSTNESQTDNFVKSTITIKDAGGNDVLYNLYIMTNSLVGNFTTTFTYK